MEYPQLKGLPEARMVTPVVKLENEQINFGGVWHSDTTYLAQPPMASMLYALEIPPYGGDTIFANQYTAYETLSEGLRRTLDGLVGVNTSTKADASKTREERLKSGRRGDEGAERASIRSCARIRRPGRKALYVNIGHTAHFKGWTEEESRPLLDYLFQHQVKTEVHLPLPVAARLRRLLGQPLRPAQRGERLRRLPAPHAPRDAGRRHSALAHLRVSAARRLPEAELVAVQVIDVEIPHAVRPVCGLLHRSGPFRLQLLVQRVHTGHEHIDRAMAGLPLRLAGRLEVNGHVVPFDSRVERRLPVHELDTKPEHVAVVLDASEHVADDEQRCSMRSLTADELVMDPPRFSVPSWAAFERPAELVDVVVIVCGKASDPFGQQLDPEALHHRILERRQRPR